MFSQFKKNTTARGVVGLSYAIDYFVRNGYTVCIPLADAQEYDLLVEDKRRRDGIKKVQVKTTSSVSGGNFRVDIRKQAYKTKLPLSRDDYDLLFVVSENGKKYLFPIDEIKSNVTLTLTRSYDKYLVG